MNYSKPFAKLNDRHVPTVYTHYYHWLEGYGHQTIGPSTALLHYLEYVFGFTYHADRVDEQTLESSRDIHYQYRANTRGST